MSESQETVVQRDYTWTGFIVTLLVVVLVIALLMPAVQQSREAARRTQSRNNLKQLGLALHNYHDNFRTFPPGGVFGADGAAYHGWTTLISPYLEQSPIYKLIDFDVPWDHPMNLGWFLIAQPYVFSNPSIHEQKSNSGLTWNHFSANQTVFHRNSSYRLDDSSLSTANTVLLGDANGDFAPVGSPYDWRSLEPGLKQEITGFGCSTRDVTMFLMADGSVRIIANLPSSETDELIRKNTSSRPATHLTAKPSPLPDVDPSQAWINQFIALREESKSGAVMRLSPDGALLCMDFHRSHGSHVPDPPDWVGYVQSKLTRGTVTRVRVTGRCAPQDIVVFRRWSGVQELDVQAELIDEKVP